MEKAYLFLNSLSLVKEKNIVKMKLCDSSKYSNAYKQLAKKGNYLEIYKYGIAYNEYDLLLKDYAFFQYSYDEVNGMIRLSFQPNPNIVKSYEEFLKQEFDCSYKDVGDNFLELYENFIDEQMDFQVVTPVRYDYDVDLYEDMIHSASHIHIGTEKNLRIATNKIFTPLGFTVLIVHNFYYPVWKEQMSQDLNFKDKILTAKKQCPEVAEQYFSTYEKQYFYIN